MNNHLNRAQMLAYLDGELSKAETAHATEHLHSCWTCRIEMERLEGDIAVILDAHKENFAPAIPPPPGAWPSFDALLARNLPAPQQPVWMRVRDALGTFLIPARGVIFAGLLAGVALFVFLKLGSHPVSAKEVLHNVQAAELRRVAVPSGQVIRERVRVRRRLTGRSESQSGSVDAWKSSKTTVWKVGDGDEAVAALQQEYKVHGVALDLPVSASAIDAWGKLAGADPSVTKQGEDLDLDFQGTSERAVGLTGMSLRVQPNTWRVEEMTLQFSDASFIVTEDDLSFVPTNEIPPVLLAELEPGPLPSLSAATTHTVSDAMASPIHLPEVNLDQVELNVLATLHRLHADLGEPVTVTHSSRTVEVGVWQLPPERQNEIQLALANKPGILVLTTPPIHPAFSPRFAPGPKVAPSTPTRITVVSDDGGGDQALLKFFGTSEKEQLYTKDVLEKSTTVLAHLYALRSLQAQFPPEREQTLSPSDRAQLDAIIKDHANAALGALSDLQSKLAPLNTAFDVATTSPAVESDSYEAKWQDASLDALDTARSADHLIRDVLTTSDTPAVPTTALPQLQQKLSHLSAEMRDLQKM